MKKFLQIHEFSNVPNKAADFYKEKDEEVAEKQAPKPKNDKNKENKDNGKGSKKNEVQKFMDEHVAIGPTETVIKMEENIKKYTETWGNRD